jgi:hypothetical protein
VVLFVPLYSLICCHLLLAEGIFYSISYKKGIPAINIAILYSSGNNFSPLFLKDSFAGYKILE